MTTRELVARLLMEDQDAQVVIEVWDGDYTVARDVEVQPVQVPGFVTIQAGERL